MGVAKTEETAEFVLSALRRLVCLSLLGIGVSRCQQTGILSFYFLFFFICLFFYFEFVFGRVREFVTFMIFMIFDI